MDNFLKWAFAVSIILAVILGMANILDLIPWFVYSWEIAMGLWCIAAMTIVAGFIRNNTGIE